MTIAIRVANLGKRYRIGVREQANKTLREAIVGAAGAPLRNLSRLRSLTKFANENGNGPADDTIWALKNVSFDVQEGDAVGIIGANGAGKSTLLKILSRITEPTTGFVQVKGRVSSLLEVGTGFHQELTGRENVYLNAAVLGMRKKEIDRKFDEIIDFSGVEKFIDTPVKRYSSGMQVRLAFAVAAHLEPEILIVDEVLAVGDAAFQKKCLNKMQDVGQEGRTVLFVSHNMAAVTRLCQRAILLDKGRIVLDGPAHKVVGEYLSGGSGTTAAREWPDPATAPGNDIVRLRAVRVRSEDGHTIASADIRKPVGIDIEFDVLQPDYVLAPNLHFYNEEGAYIFVATDQDAEWRRRPRPIGHYVSTAWVPGNLLSEGTLFVGAAVSTFEPFITHFYERDAVAFHVVDSIDGDSARGDFAGTFPGVVRPLLKWTTEVELG